MQLPVFNFSDPETNRRIFGWPAEVSSQGVGWSGIYFERRALEAEFETEEHVIQNHYLIVKLSASAPSIRSVEGRVQREFGRHGATAYVPHACPHRVIYPKRLGDLFFITLGVDVCRAVAEQLNTPAFGGIPKYAVDVDPLVLNLGLALELELRVGNPHGPIFAEIAAQMLAAHLVAEGGSPRGVAANRLALSSRRLKAVLEHIDEHLACSIRLGDLAKFSGLSEYYFCRAFHRATGLSPHQYILQRRIDLAKSRLRSTPESIEQIALSLGFSDASQFGKRFRRTVGVTPSQFRRAV